MWAYGFEFERVIDADTILGVRDAGCGIKHVCRIRVLGVDTEERFTKVGQKASSWVKWTLTRAERINVWTEKLLDENDHSMGRWLGHIVYMLNGKWYLLSEQLHERKYTKIGSKWNANPPALEQMPGRERW